MKKVIYDCLRIGVVALLLGVGMATSCTKADAVPEPQVDEPPVVVLSPELAAAITYIDSLCTLVEKYITIQESLVYGDPWRVASKQRAMQDVYATMKYDYGQMVAYRNKLLADKDNSLIEAYTQQIEAWFGTCVYNRNYINSNYSHYAH
jgi:hypothetical protein